MTPAHLAALHGRAFPQGDAWTAGDFAGLLATPATRLLAMDGAFLLARLAGDEAEILTLAVDPDGRRQGRARALLRELETTCLDGGVRSLFLEVAADNRAARALYAQMGFAEAGCRPGYYLRHAGSRIDALVLRKPLGTHRA